MRSFTVFYKKELAEQLKTYKLLIIGAVFVFIGITSPLTAVYMPNLLEAFLPESMELTLAAPTWVDSYGQFFKNFSQFGLLLMIALYIGTMSREYQSGTLVNLLTKGVPRSAIIGAKYAAALTVFTGAYVVCTGIAALYTGFYFPVAFTTSVFSALVSLYIFFAFLLALLVGVSTVSRRESTALLYLFTAFAPLLLIQFLPQTRFYNPLSLLSAPMAIVSGTQVLGDFLPALGIAIALSAALLFGAVWWFKRRGF